MKLSLGFSPCPNDTFIFDALVNKKIDPEGLEFDLFLEDVQTLNQWALEKKLDVSKISYGVYPLVSENFNLLDSGGALGKGVGPLLIGKGPMAASGLDQLTVAIPGKNTTANVLFSMAFPSAAKKKFIVFSEIENAVLLGKVDCGVIIHENRFTYQQRGLTKWVDLGNYWEEKTGLPIPLGGIVVRKNINPDVKEKLNRLIRKSIEFAFVHHPELSSFVKENSQEMEESVMRQHIDLYVNNYSISLGEEGKKAIQQFLKVFASMNNATIQPISLVG
ncbi:MAG: 1,4-dihydroxy-6-naphthoate synthase [Chitinophagales bacterium]